MIVGLWTNGRQLDIHGCSQAFLESVADWAKRRPNLDVRVVRA
jgi:hypothetical protein